MPTTVVKSIGSAGGRDYATLALWIAGSPANLVTVDQIWRGECYNDSEFTGTGNRLNITGITVGATRYIVLTCATGQSFSDNASVRSNALLYNASNGAAIRTTNNSYTHTVIVAVDYTQIIGLQISNDETSGSDYAITQSSGKTNTVIDRCIIRGGTGGRVVSLVGTIKNTLVQSRSTTEVGIDTNGATASSFIIGCTIISTGPSSGKGIRNVNSGATITNTAIFGFTTPADSLTGSYNATDGATLFGSNNQTGLTFANQFVNSASDFRAVDTGSLDLSGTPDATNIPTDISGTTRSASTPTIGAWEVAAAGGGSSWYYNRLCGVAA